MGFFSDFQKILLDFEATIMAEVKEEIETKMAAVQEKPVSEYILPYMNMQNVDGVLQDMDGGDISVNKLNELSNNITIKKDKPTINLNDTKDGGIDVSIGAEGEHFYIREPEDKNKEWFRIEDDADAYVFGKKVLTEGNGGDMEGAKWIRAICTFDKDGTLNTNESWNIDSVKRDKTGIWTIKTKVDLGSVFGVAGIPNNNDQFFSIEKTGVSSGKSWVTIWSQDNDDHKAEDLGFATSVMFFGK